MSNSMAIQSPMNQRALMGHWASKIKPKIIPASPAKKSQTLVPPAPDPAVALKAKAMTIRVIPITTNAPAKNAVINKDPKSGS